MHTRIEKIMASAADATSRKLNSRKSAKPAPPAWSEAKIAKLKQLFFREQEKNGGSLSQEDLQPLFERLGFPPGDGMIQTIFKEADVNMNEVYGFNEFFNLIQRAELYRAAQKQGQSAVPSQRVNVSFAVKYFSKEKIDTMVALYENATTKTQGIMHSGELRKFFQTAMNLNIPLEKLDLLPKQATYLDVNDVLALTVKLLSLKKRDLGPESISLEDTHLLPWAALRKAGWTVEMLKGEWKFEEFVEKGTTITEMIPTFTIQEIRTNGWTGKNAKEDGVPVENCATGFSLHELCTVCGFTDVESVTKLRKLGYPLESLKRAGYPCCTLKDAGFSNTTLRVAGYSNQVLALTPRLASATPRLPARSPQAQAGQAVSLKK